MPDAETRALGRAAVLLLVASVARWGWDAAGPRQAVSPGGASQELLERSRALAEDQEARSRPLGPDERIDPNTAGEDALDRLPGVGAATARAIVRSREAEGPFRGLQDLARVRGVGAAALGRMAPHLTFPAMPRPSSARSPRPTEKRSGGAAPPRMDVNRASPAALETLPGIGPALARRIVETRMKRPFSSVEELTRVPGIGPATLARLRPLVVAGR